MADRLCADKQDIKNERHEIRKDEIQEIENTLRYYKKKLGTANAIDTFWEAFNCSRCKTAMLIISILVTIGYLYTVIAQIPNEQLHLIEVGVIFFWTGRSTKSRDNRL